MSGIKFILDTNAVFYLLQGKLKQQKELKDLSLAAISFITELEFHSNKELSAKDRFLFEELKNSITIFYISKEDKALIKEIIAVRKKYSLKLPDAIIAATAIVNNAVLISADNIFSKIFNLKFSAITP